MSKSVSILLPALLLLSPIAKGHEGTGSLMTSFKETRKSLDGKIHGADINHGWAEDGSSLYARLWELEKMGWQAPERFVSKDRNGKFDIHGVIFRPLNFDPKKKYPVIENIYAGPHGSFVPKSWSTWYGHRSEMAEAGIIVVQIDGLGTNYRGKEFHEHAYKNLMESGLPDRIKWMKAAAEEQWMDWPVDEFYERNANVTHIQNLKGALLLTVGELDPNVDPASTYQVVDALIKADKDFEYFMAPGGGHGVGETPYLRRKRIEFFQKHLLTDHTAE